MHLACFCLLALNRFGQTEICISVQLMNLLRYQGWLMRSQALKLALDVCKGLEHLHTRSPIIIHRGGLTLEPSLLKPEVISHGTPCSCASAEGKVVVHLMKSPRCHQTIRSRFSCSPSHAFIHRHEGREHPTWRAWKGIYFWLWISTLQVPFIA